MEFNNHGAAGVAAWLRSWRGRCQVVGVNIGKTKVLLKPDAAADYAAALGCWRGCGLRGGQHQLNL